MIFGCERRKKEKPRNRQMINRKTEKVCMGVDHRNDIVATFSVGRFSVGHLSVSLSLSV
jgi:hypothetical protein